MPILCRTEREKVREIVKIVDLSFIQSFNLDAIFALNIVYIRFVLAKIPIKILPCYGETCVLLYCK